MWKSEQFVVKLRWGNARSVRQWRMLEGAVYMMTELANLCAIHSNGNEHERQADSDSQEGKREAWVTIHILDAFTQ